MSEKKDDWSFKVDQNELEEQNSEPRSASLSREQVAQQIAQKTSGEYLHIKRNKNIIESPRRGEKLKRHHELKKMEPPYASFSVRLMAALVTLFSCLLFGAVSLVFFKGDPLGEMSSYRALFPLDHLDPNFHKALGMILGFYFVPLLIFHRHLGKAWFFLSIVVAEDQSEPGPFRLVFVREILGKSLSLLFFGLGFFLPIFNQKKRALHDYLAGTIVIKKHR